MRSHPRVASSLLLVAISLAASAAGAVEIPNVGGEPMAVDVTNTAIGGYHFDNRDQTSLNDNFGELFDRFNIQVSWWRLRLGLRFDVSAYFAKPTPTDPDTIAAERRTLNTLYLSTYYPAKLWLGYTQPGIDVTVGDFYTQLGRGLVFSVRKLDELAIDTTVRGGKLVADHDFGPLRLGATAFGGQMNPQRVDEPSGRRLHGDGSPLFFGFPDRDSVDDLERIEAFTDAAGNTVNITQRSRVSYLEDAVVGGRVEGGTDDVQLAVNGAMLLRKSYTAEFNDCFYTRDADQEQQGPDTLVRGLCGNQFPEFGDRHNTVRTFSGSVNLPSIAKSGDLYVEVAGQQNREGHLNRDNVPAPDVSGYAVYAAANAHVGKVGVALEGKHYRSFLPLSANIDVDPFAGAGFHAEEFKAVAYNQPPTAEPIYVEPLGSPNICATGARGRVDYRFTKSAAAYAWLGHYVSFSEIDDKNYECDTDDAKQTNTWDTAVGTDLDFERRRSYVKAWAGIRHAETPIVSSALLNPGEIFYSEGYVRYDLLKHLAGAFSLQLQGVQRRRYKPENLALPWVEGDNYLALQWSPHISAIFGHEYSTQEGCRAGVTEGLCNYFNGALQWKSGSSDTVLEQIFDTVQLFVGQRRGGLKCVSGVCRLFPAYEGARIELVSRF